MNIHWKRRAVLCLAALLVLGALCGCRDTGSQSLPPVETQILPENEKVNSSTVFDGFAISIYTTYAEITGYTGKDTVLTLPFSAMGVPIKRIADGAFRGKEAVTKVTLPSSLVWIGDMAFLGCSSLTEAVFNDGLGSIGAEAFRDTGLTALTLPDSVWEIGRCAFYNTKITSLRLPAGVSRLGKYAFYGCQELTEIVFCPRLSEIGDHVFYNCTALTEVIVPKTVASIGNYTFSGCTSLTRVVLPKETASIGVGAFIGCPSLTLYGPKGSATEKAAGRNGYRFVAVDYDKAVTEERITP